MHSSKDPLEAPVAKSPRGSHRGQLILPERLEQRIAEFSEERLATDWRAGPPYAIPEEVDAERTLLLARKRERINYRVLSDAELVRVPVLFSFVPEDNFIRRDVVNGRPYDNLMGDVMASMTSIANPPDLRLFSRTPAYAMEFLEANLSERRDLAFSAPATMAEFEARFLEVRPRLLLLSGLNVNTRVALAMALFARRHGVEEVWLGNYASIGPYRILDEAFDRTYWGFGEEHLHRTLLGRELSERRHPPAERMLANVDWIVLDAEGQPQRSHFRTLHLALRLGCTQRCSYCAENSFSGGSRPALAVERLREQIERAHAEGVRNVYFIDPDFGRLWDDGVEGRILRYMQQKGMRFSCLTNVATLRRHGDFMIDAGLRSVYLGIETLAPGPTGSAPGAEVRSLLGRRWQIETEPIVRKLRERGILVFGLYILGNPGESLAAMEAGVRHLRDLVSLSQISTNQPFPGTREFAEAVKNRWIFSYDPDSMRYGRMIWTPAGVVGRPDDVEELYIEAHHLVNRLDREGGFLDHLGQRSAGRSLSQRPPAPPLDRAADRWSAGEVMQWSVGGKRLNVIVAKLGIAQANLASALRCNKGLVSRWLRGQCQPTKHREALVTFLELQLRDKLGDSVPSDLADIVLIDRHLFGSLPPFVDPERWTTKDRSSLVRGSASAVALSADERQGAVVVRCVRWDRLVPLTSVGRLLARLHGPPENCGLPRSTAELPRVGWALGIPVLREQFHYDAVRQWLSAGELRVHCAKELECLMAVHRGAVILDGFDEENVDEDSAQVFTTLATRLAQASGSSRLLFASDSRPARPAIGLKVVQRAAAHSRQCVAPEVVQRLGAHNVQRLCKAAADRREHLEAMLGMVLHGRKIPDGTWPEAPASALDNDERTVLTCLSILEAPVQLDLVRRIVARVARVGVPAGESHRGGPLAVSRCVAMELVSIVPRSGSGAGPFVHLTHRCAGNLGRPAGEVALAICEEFEAALAQRSAMLLEGFSSSHEHAVLAKLWMEGGRDRDAARAYVVAARRAKQSGNYLELVGHVDRAYRDLRLKDPGAIGQYDVATVYPIFKEWVERHASMGEFAEALAAINAFGPHTDLTDPVRRASVHKLQAYVLDRAGDGQQALCSLSRAITSLLDARSSGATGSGELQCLLTAWFGKERETSAKDAEIEELAATTVESFSAAGRESLHQLISTLKEAGLVYSKMGRLRDAQAQLELACLLLERFDGTSRWTSDSHEMVSLSTQLGWVYWRRGDHAWAQRYHARAILLAQRRGDLRTEIWAKIGDAHLLIDGDDRALALLETRIHEIEEVSSGLRDHLVEYNRLYLAGCLKAKRLVSDLLRRSKMKAPTMDLVICGPGPLDKGERSRYEQARALFEQAESQFSVWRFEALYARYRRLELDVLLDVVDRRVCSQEANQLLDDARNNCYARREEGIVLRIQGIVLGRDGATTAAVDKFNQAVGLLGKVGDQVEQGRAVLYRSLRWSQAAVSPPTPLPNEGPQRASLAALYAAHQHLDVGLLRELRGR